MKIAWDCDGTLTSLKDDTPRYDVIQLFKILESFGHEMYIWSGSGVSYAEMRRNNLGLQAKVVEKGSFVPDIAVDDMDASLGKVNINCTLLSDDSPF